MKLFSTLAAVAAVVTAQGQDGGVPPPAAPRAVASSPDAGTVAAAAPAPAPAPAKAVPDNSAELASVKTELKAQNEKLDAAVRELQQLRADLATRQQEQQQRQQRSDNQKQAAAAMGYVDQQLSTGDTRVEQTLSSVEETLGPSAKLNLQYARQALANSDLTTARYYLARAAQEAQAGR